MLWIVHKLAYNILLLYSWQYMPAYLTCCMGEWPMLPVFVTPYNNTYHDITHNSFTYYEFTYFWFYL